MSTSAKGSEFHSLTRRRIVMISGNAPPMMDGVGDHTAALMEELARQRPEWDWTWVSRRPRWLHSPLVHGKGYRLLRPVHTWLGPSAGLAIGTVRGLKPDLLHFQEQIHSWFESDIAVRLARAVDAPVVTTLHEYHVELSSVVHTTALVHESDRVIANDQRNAARCRSEAGRDLDDVLWSGCTVVPAEPLENASPEPGVVLTFGFLNALKSMQVVHDAIESLRQAGSPNLIWRVVGPFQPESNPQHAELKDRIGKEWVRFEGGYSVRDPQLRRLLSSARVMLLPFADGASMRRSTLQAAWALGIPVITTPSSYHEAAIVHEGNCLLVPVDDRQAWAQAIVSVLQNATLADQLRRGGLETAQTYSWPALAERHLRIYDELLRPVARQSSARNRKRDGSLS
jgi:glycosyltransferase involved in cell wall biosynthesis